MPNLTRGAIALIAAAAAFSCKGKAAKEAPKPEPAATTIDAKAEPTPAKAVTTPEAKLARYTECWNAFNGGKFDVLTTCYASNAVREQVDSVPDLVAQGAEMIVEMAKAQKAAFPDLTLTPQLVIVSGGNILSILHVGGTNSGDANGMKATGKKLGLFEAQVAIMGDDGTLSRDSFYVDQPTMFHQLGLIKNDTSPGAVEPRTPKPDTLISKNDATETANKAVVEKFVDAVNKRDILALEALVTDDIKLSFHGDKQKIETKKAFSKYWKATLASTKAGFVDVKGSWAAGDYVVIVDVFTGTPAGAAEGEDKKIETRVVQFFRIANGKIAEQHMFVNRLKAAVQLGAVDPDQLMQTLTSSGK